MHLRSLSYSVPIIVIVSAISWVLRGFVLAFGIIPLTLFHRAWVWDLNCMLLTAICTHNGGSWWMSKFTRKYDRLNTTISLKCTNIIKSSPVPVWRPAPVSRDQDRNAPGSGSSARHYSSFTNGFLFMLVSLCYLWPQTSYIILAYKWIGPLLSDFVITCRGKTTRAAPVRNTRIVRDVGCCWALDFYLYPLILHSEYHSSN